ncbi:MAG: aminoacyl-tRNA hydrolase [Phycisphaerales bacterium]|nr:aminoacyl-tRNA hydrolase [Phycisphaerales bacterium]
MKLIAGLGNPGRQYADSRHNVGFVVVDELARRWRSDAPRFEARVQGELGRVERGGQSVLLLKPMTYMNLSGQSVSAAWRYYKLAQTDVLVIYDDLDLPVGQLRVRAGGSAGGHKGLADILRHFGSEQVARIRIGIGKVDRTATVEHVLGRFAPDERDTIQAALGQAADAAECWLDEGIDAAMNRFNRRKSDEG